MTEGCRQVESEHKDEVIRLNFGPEKRLPKRYQSCDFSRLLSSSVFFSYDHRPSGSFTSSHGLLGPKGSVSGPQYGCGSCTAFGRPQYLSPAADSRPKPSSGCNYPRRPVATTVLLRRWSSKGPTLPFHLQYLLQRAMARARAPGYLLYRVQRQAISILCKSSACVDDYGS